jgi:enoyl-CoA hydratase/carnithine racemase
MLEVKQREAVLLLVLNRPEKRNSLHPDLIRELGLKLKQAETDQSVNVVIVTGSGPSFCAGLDLHYLFSLDAQEKVEYLTAAVELFERLYRLPQPVIAAVNGPAVAGGFDLAAVCDLRFCTPTATFAQAEVLLGITPLLFPLHKIAGLARAKETAFTGEAISAEQAYNIGLVNRICPAEELLDQALAMATKLALRPREALFETKRLSREVIDLDASSAFKHTADTIGRRLRSEEHRQELEKYLAKLRQRTQDRQ